jgi:hypothetical protein
MSESDESSLRPETWDDMYEIAASRARATGKPVVVTTFSGATKATVYDADFEDGSIEEQGVVPLLEPSPGHGPPAKRPKGAPSG